MARNKARADHGDENARTRPAENHQVESLSRGLQILDMFTLDMPDINTLQASKRLGCSQSTAYRLMQTLVQNGFLRQDPVTKRYSLSLKVVALASTVLDSMDLRRQAIPEMEELARICDARVNLAIQEDVSIVWVARVEGPNIPRMYFHLGKQAPLHATGLGKVLLAHLPPAELDGLLERLELKAMTGRTIVDRAELRRHLEAVREQGYALDHGEYIDEVRALAVPVRDQAGRVVAALSVSGPVPNVTMERLDQLKGDIFRCAQRISQKLGYFG